MPIDILRTNTCRNAKDWAIVYIYVNRLGIQWQDNRLGIRGRLASVESCVARGFIFIVYIRISPIVISMFYVYFYISSYLSYVYFYISSYLTFISKPHPTLHHCIYPHLTHRHIHVTCLFYIPCLYFYTAPHTSPHTLSSSPFTSVSYVYSYPISHYHQPFYVRSFLPFLFITPLCVDSLVCTFTVTVLSSFIWWLHLSVGVLPVGDKMNK